jgi:cytochrome c553
MSRVVVFCLFLGALAYVMNLSHYSDVKVNNAKFSFDEAKKKHEEHLKEVEELTKIHKEATAVKVISDDIIVEEKPLVVLDTPQLVRADKLYKQCISCHGKAGEGKKAQKAPKIGGQMQWYISKQLLDMKSGVRVNATMTSIVKKLSPEDIADLSAYVAKLPWNMEE